MLKNKNIISRDKVKMIAANNNLDLKNTEFELLTDFETHILIWKCSDVTYHSDHTLTGCILSIEATSGEVINKNDIKGIWD